MRGGRRIVLQKKIRLGISSAQMIEFSFFLHHCVGPHSGVGVLFFRLTINERKCTRVISNVTDDFIRNLRFFFVVIPRHGICLKHRGHHTYHLLYIRHSSPFRHVIQGGRKVPVRLCKKGAALCWNWGKSHR